MDYFEDVSDKATHMAICRHKAQGVKRREMEHIIRRKMRRARRA